MQEGQSEQESTEEKPRKCNQKCYQWVFLACQSRSDFIVIWTFLYFPAFLQGPGIIIIIIIVIRKRK